MEHQALARKWRPRSFDQMVGQEHVLKALINALDQNRLHHAYLFTGTRGVGKTTIARILSKCLNCEAGVSSVPCNECSTCKEIDQGRCIDLIEVDAASRTKVEDTRELLENVQYAPTRARYKVYIIDEVHMLSAHSFNALLKTLEEPPPHVKFLLATTDPQKLPITVLSRCLQFNLRNLAPELIVGHLKQVLEAENIECDEPALWQLGRAADGSMRDALSLTDQAVAYGQNSVFEKDVSAMLGSIDRGRIHQIFDMLINEDAAGLLQQVRGLADFSPDYSKVLEQLLSILHQAAVAQVVPEAFDRHVENSERILGYAQQLTAEDLQLYYQIALTGRGDLPLHPDQKAGLEMLLLRMLAFKPGNRESTESSGQDKLGMDEKTGIKPVKKKLTSNQEQPLSRKIPETSTSDSLAIDAGLKSRKPGISKMPEEKGGATHSLALVKNANKAKKPDLAVNNISDTNTAQVRQLPVKNESQAKSSSAPKNQRRAEIAPADQSSRGRSALSEYETLYQSSPGSDTDNHSDSSTRHSTSPSETAPFKTAQDRRNMVMPHDKQREVSADTSHEQAINDTVEKTAPPPLLENNQAWLELVQRLKLKGMSRNILMQCTFKGKDSDNIYLLINEQFYGLLNASHQERIVKSLVQILGYSINVIIDAGVTDAETPALYQQRQDAERLQKAKMALENDENVQQLIEQFDAVLEDDSIFPLD